MLSDDWQVLNEGVKADIGEWPEELVDCDQATYSLTEAYKLVGTNNVLLGLSELTCLQGIKLLNTIRADEIIIQLPPQPVQLSGNWEVVGKQAALTFISKADLFVHDFNAQGITQLQYIMGECVINDLDQCADSSAKFWFANLANYIKGQCNVKVLEQCNNSSAKLWLADVTGNKLLANAAKILLAGKINFPEEVVLSIYDNDAYVQQFVVDGRKLEQLGSSSFLIHNGNSDSLGINLFGEIISQATNITSQSYLWLAGKVLGQDLKFTANDILLSSSAAIQTASMIIDDTQQPAQTLVLIAKQHLLCEAGAQLLTANGLLITADGQLTHDCAAQNANGSMVVNGKAIQQLFEKQSLLYNQQGSIYISGEQNSPVLNGQMFAKQGSLRCEAQDDILLSGNVFADKLVILKSKAAININAVPKHNGNDQETKSPPNIMAGVTAYLEGKHVYVNKGATVVSKNNNSVGISVIAEESIKLEGSLLNSQAGIKFTVKDEQVGLITLDKARVFSNTYFRQAGRVLIKLENSFLVGDDFVSITAYCLDIDAGTAVMSKNGTIKLDLERCELINRGSIGTNNRLELQVNNGNFINEGTLVGGRGIDFKILRGDMSNIGKLYSNEEVRFGVGRNYKLYFGPSSHTEVGTYQIGSFANDIWKVGQVICDGCQLLKTGQKQAAIRGMEGVIRVFNYAKITEFVGEKTFTYDIYCEEDGFLFWTDTTCYGKTVNIRAFQEKHKYGAVGFWHNQGDVIVDIYQMIVDASRFSVVGKLTVGNSLFTASDRQAKQYVDVNSEHITQMNSLAHVQGSFALTDVAQHQYGNYRISRVVDSVDYHFEYGEVDNPEKVPARRNNDAKPAPKGVPEIDTEAMRGL